MRLGFKGQLFLSLLLGLGSFGWTQTAPVITAQDTISISEDVSYTVTTSVLTISNSTGNESLLLSSGSNYTLSGTVVIPDEDYSGALTVPTRVVNENGTSPFYDLLIDVQPVEDAPTITGQATINMIVNVPRTFSSSDLTFTDPDSTGTFTMTISTGSNYTFTDLTVTPATDYSGYLFIPATITDPEGNVSSSWTMVVLVSSEDGRPIIVAQESVSTDEEEGIWLDLSMVTVEDLDSVPSDLVLVVNDGPNYSHTGNYVTPNTDLTGTQYVCMYVNDSTQDGPVYLFALEVNPINDAPSVTGQVNVETDEDTSRTLVMDDLIGSDVDSEWPADMTIRVLNGVDYTHSGATFTPDEDVNGTITVTVVVNDGEDDSSPFDLSVTVTPVNDAAVLTGQNEINMVAGVSRTFTLSDLVGYDVDDTWSSDHTLQVLEGDDYTINGNVVTTSEFYEGNLLVNVRVFDGEDYSAVRALSVDVTGVNDTPTITGQYSIYISEGDSYTITTNDLQVTDEDNEWPEDFTVTVFDGADYDTNGNTITPEEDFNGTLYVPVRVNDGTYDSNTFTLTVYVRADNDAPVIIGQVPLSTDEETPLEILLIHLFVDDPDDAYPTGFFIDLDSGNNYRVSGHRIIPGNNFNGVLDVNVQVYDGLTTSKVFKLAVSVLPVNDAPYIHGQEVLTVYQGNETTLSLEQFDVSDPDNTYPDEFTLAVHRGDNYTTSGTTVIPDPDFAGTLLVPVTVHDGQDVSNRFTVTIYVQPVSSQGLPGSLSLDAASYSVCEEDDGLRVRVHRTGGRTGILEALLQTTEGSAEEGDDYLITSIPLTFTDGDDTEKEILVPIVEDDESEGSEFFSLQLLETNSSGKQLQQATVAIVDNEEEMPQTTITSPLDESHYLVGQNVTLEAVGEDPQDDALSFVWEVRGPAGQGLSTTQNKRQTLTFETPGLYHITCYAVDSEGNADLIHDQVTIEIRESLAPEIKILAPNLPVTADTSDQLQFQAALPEGTSNPRWSLAGSEGVLSIQNSFQHRFSEPGTYTLVLEAEASDGTVVSDWHGIHISPEGARKPVLQLSLSQQTTVRDAAILPTAMLVDPDGLMPNASFFWDLGDGRVRWGYEPPAFAYDETGRYALRCMARSGDVVVEAAVMLEITDPLGAPTVAIDPPIDLELRPLAQGEIQHAGNSVFLHARTLDDLAAEHLRYYWDFGDGRTSRQQTPGLIGYAQPGQYQITLCAAAPGGPKGITVSRTITVRNNFVGRFEPNDRLELAKTIQPGAYDLLQLSSLSPADWYHVSIPEDGYQLILNLQGDGPVNLDVYDADQNLVQSIQDQGQINLRHLEAGELFLSLTLPDPEAREATNYQMSVDLRSPQLFFPELRYDHLMRTQPGLVNPGETATGFRLELFDATGNLLDALDGHLEPGGHFWLDTATIFGDELARRATWARVFSEHALKGYTISVGGDGKEMYATPAANGLTSRLYVPHVAQQTNLWYTRNALVSSDVATHETRVQLGNWEEVLSGYPFGTQSFTYTDLFGANLPADAPWALLQQTNQAATLAGLEIFGTRDGLKRTAGLTLQDLDGRNPSAHQGPYLLTHIARDTANFWTGVALLNPEPLPQTVTIRGYGDDGQLVGQRILELAAFEKYSAAIEAFLGQIGTPAQVAWAAIDAPGKLLGFELFGTHDGTRLAGLDLVTASTNKLCFSHIWESDLVHGLAILNPSDSPVTPTLSVYDPHGDLIARRSDLQFAPNQKRSFALDQLFPHLPSDRAPAWLEVSGDGPLAGFQLLLGANGQQMGAMAAQ